MMTHEYIKSLLSTWSEWRIRRTDGGSGYPSKSAFLTIPGGGSWISEIDSQCYEVDDAVCQLEIDYKDVIIKHYTQTGTKQQKAERCGCSIRTYDARLIKSFELILIKLNELRKVKEYRRLHNR